MTESMKLHTICHTVNKILGGKVGFVFFLNIDYRFDLCRTLTQRDTNFVLFYRYLNFSEKM